MSYLPMADDHQPEPYNDDNLDDDVDVDGDDDSTSSPSPSVAGEVTIAVAGVNVTTTDSPSLKRPRIDDFSVPIVLPGTKKPSLFQRLWTDEDEVELLQGFLDYTAQRGLNSSSQQHHYDTTAFYDQIKCKFQLDFNKNQLVEKLRRLKKKYRTVMSKMGSGKEFVFKSAHDQVTFEISRKIWGNGGGSFVRNSPGGSTVLEYDEDATHLNPNHNPDAIVVYNNSPKFNLNSNPNPNGIAVKTPRSSQKRSPPVPTEPVKVEFQPSGGPIPTTNSTPMAAAPVAGAATVAASVPSLIEETVRSCVSPIFKELLNNVANLNGPSRGFGFGFGGMGMSPIPFGFGGGGMNMEMMGDEKWRKQQMLELEVYSKRLELVQDQVKAQLEELRSMGN
ncbi:probable transcription factor At3g04930 [Lycium ferocissimum]|uniref:probable transcription factor At3g04930 n=1 Tax=Lycium ferocissimum TaxID=112874 RepID=UPI002814B3CD|nr:probable transcription factor At3g04930 [Lycium ferocissimum]